MSKESNAEELRRLVHERTKLATADIKCPREKSFMTPCVVRDADFAESDGNCIGCFHNVEELLKRERLKH